MSRLLLSRTVRYSPASSLFIMPWCPHSRRAILGISGYPPPFVDQHWKSSCSDIHIQQATKIRAEAYICPWVERRERNKHRTTFRCFGRSMMVGNVGIKGRLLGSWQWLSSPLFFEQKWEGRHKCLWFQWYYQARQLILKLLRGYHTTLPGVGNYKGKETSALTSQSLKPIGRSSAFLFCKWRNKLAV